MADGSADPVSMATIDVRQIAARTLLCTLTTKAWRATRLHRAETRAERQRHGNKAPRVLVTVCEHPALREIAKLQARAYAEHRRLTLPSVQNGIRLLPSSRQLEHADTMRRLADQHGRLVARFIADYGREAAEAPARLGSLYDAKMWPDADEVAGRFALSTRYLFCPSDGAWAEWLAESARAAQDHLADRLRQALERVRDRCRGDGHLYETVFSSLGDLVQLVPDLDISGCQALRTIAQSAEPLAGLSAERLDSSARRDVAAKAERLLGMFTGLR